MTEFLPDKDDSKNPLVDRYELVDDVLSLLRSNRYDEAFRYSIEILEDRFELRVLIELGRLSLTLGTPHLALPFFFKYRREIVGNSWAVLTFRRILDASAIEIDKLSKGFDGRVFGEKVELTSDEKNSLRHHVDSCFEHRLPIDEESWSLFCRAFPRDPRLFPTQCIIFRTHPPITGDFDNPLAQPKNWSIAPAAEIFYEQPAASWIPRVASSQLVCDQQPLCWLVREATVYMLPGLYGLVQFSDGTFYDPEGVGSIHPGQATSVLSFGNQHYIAEILIPLEQRSQLPIIGSAVLPFRFAATYYFHYLMEAVKLVSYAAKHLPSSPIVLPVDINFFHRMSQPVFEEGIKAAAGKSELAWLQNGIYKIDKLYIPRSWNYGGLSYINEVIKSLNLTSCPEDAKRIILIKRPAYQGRYVTNEDELIETLSIRYIPFLAISLDGMSFSEQAQAFRDARVVICPHGGGLTNIVFCDEGTLVVELVFRNSDVSYRDISFLRNLRYVAYAHTDTTSDDINTPSQDIKCYVDPDQLCSLIDRCI